jgi:hypothetical protein
MYIGTSTAVPDIEQALCVLVLNEPLVERHVHQLILTADQLIEHVIRPLCGLARGQVGRIRGGGRTRRPKYEQFLKFEETKRQVL